MRLLHNPQAARAPARDGSSPGAAKQAIRFGVHVLEMCAVMCLGGGLLMVLFFGGASVLGYPDLPQTAPALSALTVATCLAASMVAWMRFRGMEWRPTLEMAGSSIAVGVLVIAGYWLGIVPGTVLIQLCGVACVAMIAIMLFRFDLYASHAGHHAPAG